MNTLLPPPSGSLHPLVGQGERDILVTVYIYDLGSKAVNVDLGHVMRDLDCSYFATCELKQRFFTIGTDALATDEQCVERFISALKAAGVDIGKHEWSTLPNDQVSHIQGGLDAAASTTPPP